MPKPSILEHPVRLHVNLEKSTLRRLQKLARQRAQSVTHIMRELAESFASGHLSFRKKEPLGDIVKRIAALRERSTMVRTSSEEIVRSLRDTRG